MVEMSEDILTSVEGRDCGCTDTCREEMKGLGLGER
jgi:hypothetical protein